MYCSAIELEFRMKLGVIFAIEISGSIGAKDLQDSTFDGILVFLIEYAVVIDAYRIAYHSDQDKYSITITEYVLSLASKKFQASDDHLEK